MLTGKLHLTPLNCILQMRAAFNHLDEHLDEIVEGTESNSLVSVTSSHHLPDVEDKPSPELKRVKAQLKRGDKDRAFDARRNTYAYMQQQRLAEKFVDLEIHESDVRGLY